jgi:hypothetical protein
LFDKAHRQAKKFAEDKVYLTPRSKQKEDDLSREDLAELIVTLDPITTGFMEDL